MFYQKGNKLENKKFYLFILFVVFCFNVFSYDYYPQFIDKVEFLNNFNKILIDLNINHKSLAFSEINVSDIVFDNDLMCYVQKISQKDSPNSIVFDANTNNILYLTTLSKPFDKELDTELSVRLKALYYAGILFSIPLEQIEIKDIRVHPEKKDVFFIRFNRKIDEHLFYKDSADLTMDKNGNLILFQNRMLSDIPQSCSKTDMISKKRIRKKIQELLHKKVISFNGFKLDNMKIKELEIEKDLIVNPDYFLDDKLIFNNLKILKSGGMIDDVISYLPLIRKSFHCIKVSGSAYDRSVLLDFVFYIDLGNSNIIKTERFDIGFEKNTDSTEDYFEDFEDF